jgi:hypothetical protein
MGRMRASANEQSGRWSCARQHQRGRGTPPRARFVCFLQINDSTYSFMALEAQKASQPARCCALGRSRSLSFARVQSGPSWSILVHPGPSWSILVHPGSLACTRVALACARVRSRLRRAVCVISPVPAGWLAGWCAGVEKISDGARARPKQPNNPKSPNASPARHAPRR